MGSAGSILVVDDDPQIRSMVVEYLSAHGFELAEADSGIALRARIEESLPDLVLLDVRLPGEDGLTLARYLRERYDVGIIMVTAAGHVVDRVVGLEVGADDYIAKPFDPRELLARIKSVVRRMQPRQPGNGASASDSNSRAATSIRRVPIGRCSLDVESRQLFDESGAEMPLTAMEFDLLQAFLSNPRRVLSRDQLLTLTRNREWEPFDRSIDIRIARVRRKIERDPKHPTTIRTVRNAGYMYVPDAD
ncbi:MAG TPA: response regulator [Burkholderiaceae bacterium]|nr:response regulator [Burkholderiaceae bacterium]